jgi:hypothetical protein
VTRCHRLLSHRREHTKSICSPRICHHLARHQIRHRL